MSCNGTQNSIKIRKGHTKAIHLMDGMGPLPSFLCVLLLF